MKPWLRRNRLAFAVIMVMAGLIAGTVTYPQWSRQIGFKRPEQTVPTEQWADVHGGRWRLSVVSIPAADPSLTYSTDDQPEGSRLVSYVLDREHDGKPTGLPEGFRTCGASMVDGNRRWTRSATASRVYRFALEKGYTTVCQDDGPYLLAMYVPDDATVNAIEVLLQPGERPAGTGGEVDENAPVFQTYDESPIVIRFQTS